jgi:membrane protease YdiL (CAAX protease family)
VVDERVTPPWQPWEAVPVALGAFVAALVVSVVLAAVVGIGGPALLLSGLAFQLSLAGFSALWVAIRHRGWLPALGLRSGRPASDVAIGVFAGVALFALAAFLVLPTLSLLFEGLVGRPPDPINQLPFELSPGLIILGVVVVVLGAPLGEEVFFRGFLYGSLRGRFGYWIAGSFSSVVFGLFHAGVSWLLVPLMFVVGMGLAFLYERRGALLSSMAAHAAFNIVGYTLIVLART